MSETPIKLQKKAKVYVVGAGPGDPDLLTVKAHRVILEANVILYDALIDDRLKALFPTSAQAIYVGKRANDNTCQTARQNNINEIYLNLSDQKINVVRIKSGDPLIFARGMEEVRFLKENEIDFELVPGISAGLAGASLFSIPLTERAIAPSILLSSGVLLSGGLDHLKPSIALLKEGSAIMIYMSVKRILEIKKYLIENGIDKNTSLVILSRISAPDQKKFVGTLNNVESLIVKEIPSPSLVILGNNVNSI